MAKSYLPLRTVDQWNPLSYLTPYPRKVRMQKYEVDLAAKAVGCECAQELRPLAESFSADVYAVAGCRLVQNNAARTYPIRLKVKNSDLPAEGYTLEIGAEGIEVVGQDRTGLFYGLQTLLQLIGFGQGKVPGVKLRDWPAYRMRGVMLDMGRGIYSRQLIERSIRIMARLKLNLLHLHLYDDELMGIRFKGLKLGSENRFAISMAELKEIIAYARQYNVAVCPEMESWGHVNSITYHYPECYGAKGKYGGASFGIGRATFELLEKIYEEVIPCVESESLVHLGMDEANWKIMPDMEGKAGVNPEWLIGRLYDLVMAVGLRYRKKLQLCIWADHCGRPIPAGIRDKVIVQPWNYWERAEADIRKKARRYGGTGKAPFLFGAGQSSLHLNGAFGATRIWAKGTCRAPNCLGGTICLWEGNALDQYLVSLYAGSNSLWNPQACCQPEKNDLYREYLTGQLVRQMMSWQTLFSDAEPAAIVKDRGPSVYIGYYVSGPKAGWPAAPTAM